MKRFLIVGIFALVAGGQAPAADLPPAPPPPPRAPAAYIPVPVPLYNWTGFYLGGNLGGVFSGLSASDLTEEHLRQHHQPIVPRWWPGWRQLSVLGRLGDWRRGRLRLASQHQEHHHGNATSGFTDRDYGDQ